MISAVDLETSGAGAGADLVAQVEEVFSTKGVLSRARNFEFRPEQQQMAVAVAKTLQGENHLVVEAGAGGGEGKPLNSRPK